MNLGKILYVAVLVLILVGGMALLVVAEFRSFVVHDHSLTELLAAVSELRPDFSHLESLKLRARLEPWVQAMRTHSFWLELMRHLGIALIVAVVLTAVIESWARLRLQEEVRTGVVEAAFRRLIDPAVFEEIKASVIGSKVIRRHWVVDMSIYRDDQVAQIDDSYYVSRTTVSYRLQNLTGSSHQEPLAAELDLDITGTDKSGPLPRFESVRLQRDLFEGEQLKTLLDERGCSYQKTVTVSPRGEIEVVNRVVEIIRVPDTFVWNTRHQTTDAQIIIDVPGNSDIGCEVTLLHPDRDGLAEEVSGRSWRFPGALLPWQGFQVRTFLREAERKDRAQRKGGGAKAAGDAKAAAGDVKAGPIAEREMPA